MKKLLSYGIVFLMTACNQPTVEPGAKTRLLSVENTSTIIKPMMHKGESSDLWAYDIHHALETISHPPTPDNVCAVIAIIAQESGFKADPEVSGIRQILAKKITKMQSNPILAVALNLRLSQTANNGKSFRTNMQNIRTEHDFEMWYNEFTAEKYTFAGLKYLHLDINDLVTTAGSMQVSIDYAKSIATQLGQSSNNMREQIYDRAGGILYGTAHLLYYPSDYSAMYYRFADYNAGHYASRNAGFQKMLINLTKNKTIGQDGDLLFYRDGTAQASKTYRALLTLAKKQGKNLSETDLMSELKREKADDFTQTWVYQWVSAQHQEKFGSILKEQTPDIVLKSDKITRKLTTQWYADNVNRRFKNCLARTS